MSPKKPKRSTRRSKATKQRYLKGLAGPLVYRGKRIADLIGVLDLVIEELELVGSSNRIDLLKICQRARDAAGRPEPMPDYGTRIERLKPPEILRNRAQCLECGEIIESTHRHDFRTCKCGALSVDGGRDYLRRSFKSADRWNEMSETK